MSGVADPNELVDVVVRLPRATIVESLRMSPDGKVATLKTPYLSLASGILASRQRRREFFGTIHFGEPCWDMILELYVAAVSGKSINVTKLCAASGRSITTALRHLEDMEARGYFVRQADDSDARSTLVVMQASLGEAVEAWLDCLVAMTGVLQR